MGKNPWPDHAAILVAVGVDMVYPVLDTEMGQRVSRLGAEAAWLSRYCLVLSRLNRDLFHLRVDS